ncbi:hypothetical protein RHMOL_Rhmol07G0242800 [Rhododendron molle]|uniref:Uncharacterized protein n=1 Tax=Rhododendron molle TaxID=49168 RepID=A0ACC0N648_RHOML|nr:hypothetical protein RHMOL_Rhmol07G0242800 [Rhododendron molle]
MNEALPLKWWWRFGTQKKALWRKIIYAKYKINTNCWMPNMGIDRKVSTIWRDNMLIQARIIIFVIFFFFFATCLEKLN